MESSCQTLRESFARLGEGLDAVLTLIGGGSAGEMTDDNSSESAAPSTLDAIIKLFLSLILPSLYVGGLALVFKLFQRWNTLRLLSSSRKHKDNPYFGRHYARDMYLELSEQYAFSCVNFYSSALQTFPGD